MRLPLTACAPAQDQHPRGYARLIDEMVRDTVPAGDPRLVLNATVTKIQYDCDAATVTTSDGRSFTAREVISTLPLGVLQRKHASLFDPPLPQKHADLLTGGGILISMAFSVVLLLPQSSSGER